MYNYFMLIGYVCANPEVREVKDGKKVTNLLLAVKRDFKNSDGEYDTDFIRVTVWDYMTDIAVECLKKGSRVGVKGRIVPITNKEDGKTSDCYEIRGERFFLLDGRLQTEENNQ